MVYGWPCVGIAQSVNTWITVLVTVHRFIAIVSPHKAIVYCTYTRARIHLIVIALFTACYEIPTFFDNEVKEIKAANSTLYVPAYCELNLNYWYQLLYKTTFYYLIMYIIPWILLCVMTMFLVNTIKHAKEFRHKMGNNPNHQDNTEDITTSLVAIVVTSLLCGPFEPIRRIIVSVLQREPGCGHFYYYFEEFPSLTAAINSSANFVLYLLFLKRFTKTLKHLFISKEQAKERTSVVTGLSIISTENN